jgi:hypothetical protein
MAKPQLPAKAEIMKDGYREWFYTANNPLTQVCPILDTEYVTVISEFNNNRWWVESPDGCILAAIPKQYIEFKPPVCPKCEGSGYQTIQQLNSRMRIAKKCDCQ